MRRWALVNEEMISKLRQRLDVERISPISDQVKQIAACAARVEAKFGAAAGLTRAAI